MLLFPTESSVALDTDIRWAVRTGRGMFKIHRRPDILKVKEGLLPLTIARQLRRRADDWLHKEFAEHRERRVNKLL